MEQEEGQRRGGWRVLQIWDLLKEECWDGHLVEVEMVSLKMWKRIESLDVEWGKVYSCGLYLYEEIDELVGIELVKMSEWECELGKESVEEIEVLESLGQEVGKYLEVERSCEKEEGELLQELGKWLHEPWCLCPFE